MSDEDAFLKKLLENPADDTVRLVYADWLDENEQPAAALKSEFLRLEAEPSSTDDRREQIQGRLQFLVADLEPNWLAVVSKLTIENCPNGGTEVSSSGVRTKKLKWKYLCPRKWEELQITSEGTVRFCTSCRQNVYYCNTIEAGRDHVEDGHCVVINLGVIRRNGDLESESELMGLLDIN